MTVDHTTVVVVILPLKHNMGLVWGIFETQIPHLSIKAVPTFNKNQARRVLGGDTADSSGPSEA